MDLAARRQAARSAGDYPEADRLRDAIAAAGWKVRDQPGGAYSLSAAAPEEEAYGAYAAVGSTLGEAAACRHSVCIAYHGWPGDVARLLRRLVDTAPGPGGELELVLARAESAGLPGAGVTALTGPALSRPPVHVAVRQELGHSQLLNVAARRALGEFVHFVEPSLEFDYQVLEAAAAVLADPRVGACGPFGLTTADWREFHPVDGDEVMALEYLISVRRADLPRIGEMDTGFRFYRNLDIDYSRQVLACGLALACYDAEITRHTHRLWEATPPDERDRLSRRNFNRLLDRWVRPAEA